MQVTPFLGNSRPDLVEKIKDYREKRAQKILEEELPSGSSTMGFKP